ncbi:GNAT family protein [Halobacillus rhizosphaerae]|uniref:GNAT family N-acetyltransferase n=1 Tax=Halobacillus rhizosphaerae TaxID=3064889 RepID=UPI00398B2F75
MIELKYFDRSAFQQLIQWIDSPEFLLQWGGPQFEFPLDEEQLEVYLKGANTNESDSLIYSVFLDEPGELIGHISLGKIDRNHKSARVGKVLVGAEEVRGQGIGQKMIEEILKIAFDELDLHRVSLNVFDFNYAAISCYEKSGFTKEGLLKDARKVGHHYWSLWEMAILEHEWAERKSSR